MVRYVWHTRKPQSFTRLYEKITDRGYRASPNTVQKYLDRLVDQGILKRKKVGRYHQTLYSQGGFVKIPGRWNEPILPVTDKAASQLKAHIVRRRGITPYHYQGPS